MQKKILVGVTTVHNPHWEKQIEDIKRFGLREFALFVTDLDAAKRIKCYEMLEKLPKITIPFVHMRTDMIPAELRYLEEKFGAEYFNIHSLHEYPLKYVYGELKHDMLIENVWVGLYKTELAKFEGICLDLSHLENDRQMRPAYFDRTERAIEKFPVIANHVSAVMPKAKDYGKDGFRVDNHELSDPSELDYVLRYPKNYFGQYIALELINDIETKIKARNYLENILKGKGII